MHTIVRMMADGDVPRSRCLLDCKCFARGLTKKKTDGCHRPDESPVGHCFRRPQTAAHHPTMAPKNMLTTRSDTSKPWNWRTPSTTLTALASFVKSNEKPLAWPDVATCATQTTALFCSAQRRSRARNESVSHGDPSGPLLFALGLEGACLWAEPQPRPLAAPGLDCFPDDGKVQVYPSQTLCHLTSTHPKLRRDGRFGMTHASPSQTSASANLRTNS